MGADRGKELVDNKLFWMMKLSLSGKSGDFRAVGGRTRVQHGLEGTTLALYRVLLSR